jgi:hypothetical protein
MGAEVLSSRAIIGGFYSALEATANTGLGLMLGGRPFNSDQPSETYPWLGAVPKLSEWNGGRVAQNLRDFGFTIRNVEYSAEVEFRIKDLRRDKSGQIMARIGELAEAANLHWDELAVALIEAAHAATCYDGQYFFDTDHLSGDSGTQSNLLTIDLTGLPVAVHGAAATAPSAQEAAEIVLRMVSAILAFKDDRGRPRNRNARKFAVVVPTPLYAVFQMAVSAATFAGGASNPVGALKDIEITVHMAPELTWTTSVACFRVDGMAQRPIVLQEETPALLSSLADGSDYAKLKKKHLYMVDADRAAGYGEWAHACKVNITKS